MAFSDSLRSLTGQAVSRYRTGMARVREGFFQSLQIVVSGIGAYAFAEAILGHREPIFAATAAIVSLGFVRGATHARRMLEVTLGVTLGILIGDALMLVLGRGLWQAAIVLFISILVARFLDNGIIFTIQMGLQSCLVVLMAPTADGPFARSLDAIVGGIFAFLMMFLFPKDPRVAPRVNALKLMNAYSAVLNQSVKAMRAYSSDLAQENLERARRLQGLYDAADGDVVTAKGMAQISLLGKNRLRELEEFSATLNAVDLAIRNTRVLVRRMASTIGNVQISETAIESISDTLQQISGATALLGEAMAAPDQQVREALKSRAQNDLVQVAQTLDPALMGVRTMEAESLVLMIRPLVIDLIEATGLPAEEAGSILIPLGESMTEHAPRTSGIRQVAPAQTPRITITAAADSTDDTDGEELDSLAPDDTRALNVVLRSDQHKRK